MHRWKDLVILSVVALAAAGPVQAPRPPKPLQELKSRAVEGVEGRRKVVQEIVDSLFSFGELGFQEVETQRYLTTLLREKGFEIETPVAGIPTAWVARWGHGRPVVALGSDVDAIPQASQKPGVAYRAPLVEGAPGHGEGHNSGLAVVVAAALAVKDLLEAEALPGTIVIWPGIAEELLGAKAHFVRAGVFRDVEAVLFCHVSSELFTYWGPSGGSGLVSVEYRFQGQAAHSAVDPWNGRSALHAVELMNAGWNYRREHLRLQQRSHYVISDGGDQPNVVPQTAAVWYYFRETEYPRILELWKLGDKTAAGAALMTDTTFQSRVLGSAWPGHMNRPIAAAMHANALQVGMPRWSADDQAMARAIQQEIGAEARGLGTEVARELFGRETVPDRENLGGASDDIGDISWNVPTVVLSYPANIRGGPAHHWSKAIAMATPIAHKGSTAGAKVMALTLLDVLLTPQLLRDAWTYFRDVQERQQHYVPLLGPEDRPAIWLNSAIMERYRSKMREFYYDPARASTYLEQLGIRYPTVRTTPTPDSRTEVPGRTGRR
jgi:aminobenzoyl-glutamate utilization protein B